MPIIRRLITGLLSLLLAASGFVAVEAARADVALAAQGPCGDKPCPPPAPPGVGACGPNPCPEPGTGSACGAVACPPPAPSGGACGPNPCPPPAPSTTGACGATACTPPAPFEACAGKACAPSAAASNSATAPPAPATDGKPTATPGESTAPPEGTAGGDQGQLPPEDPDEADQPRAQETPDSDKSPLMGWIALTLLLVTGGGLAVFFVRRRT